MTATTTALALHGTITEPDPDHPGQTRRVVYQSTAPGAGNLPGSGSYDAQRRAWVKPRDVCTAAQWRRRAVMRAAAAYYKTVPERYAAAASTIAAARHLTTQQAWAAAFAADQAAPGAPLWDAQIAAWDDGAAVWDVAGCRWDATDLAVWDQAAAVWRP